MSNEIAKTDYKIESFENSDWVRVFKNNKVYALCMNEEAGLHAIWCNENKEPDYFYVADNFGVVGCVDRGAL